MHRWRVAEDPGAPLQRVPVDHAAHRGDQIVGGERLGDDLGRAEPLATFAIAGLEEHQHGGLVFARVGRQRRHARLVHCPGDHQQVGVLATDGTASFVGGDHDGARETRALQRTIERDGDFEIGEGDDNLGGHGQCAVSPCNWRTAW